MASEEAVILRRAEADQRVVAAVGTLAERAGVAVSDPPPLPREVDPGFRQMIEREVLAGTLEQLVTVGDRPTFESELLEVAVGLLADALDITVDEAADRVGEIHDRNTADQEAEEEDADQGSKGDGTEESDDPEASINGQPEDLDALTRPELNELATSLGIPDASEMRNKPTVIAAIGAARAATETPPDPPVGSTGETTS